MTLRCLSEVNVAKMEGMILLRAANWATPAGLRHKAPMALGSAEMTCKENERLMIKYNGYRYLQRGFDPSLDSIIKGLW